VTADPGTVFPLPPDDALNGFTYPAAQYDHEEGRAIAGGLVYGRAGTSLTGQFVFGDIVTGRLFYSGADALLAAHDGDPSTTAEVRELHLSFEGSETTLLDLVRGALGRPEIGRVDLRLGTDASGRLYVTTKQDGYLRELVPSVGRFAQIYWMNDGSTGFGEPVLFADNRFEDAVSGVLTGCGALLLGRFTSATQVVALRLCTDGSGARGVFLGAFLE
jgi:hypothetical protein